MSEPTTTPPTKSGSTLTLRMLQDAMSEVDAVMYPWRSLVGLVPLHESQWVTRGEAFACNAIKDMVVIHPEDVQPFKDQLQQAREPVRTDDDLAAFIFWRATET